MKKIGIILLLCLLLSSCIGVESRIVVNDDGSGQILLDYRISHMVADLGKLDNQERLVPLPVTEEDFRRTADGVPGLTLENFSLKRDERDLRISGELAFSDAGALEAFLTDLYSDQAAVSVNETGGSFSFLLYAPAEEPVAEESLALVDAFFEGYRISWSLKAPRPLTEAAGGELGEAGTVYRFEASVGEIIRQNQPVVLSASW